MPAATFKIEPKDQPNQDGTHSLRIRITRHRRHAYYNTGIRILVSGQERKSEWNPKGTYGKHNWVKSNNRDHKLYNDQLATAWQELQELSAKNPQLNARELKERYALSQEPEAVAAPKGLLNFWQVWIDRKRALGKEGTAVLYETARSYLLSFTGPDPEEATILTPRFAADYLAWLRREDKATKKKAYSPSTCNEALGQLNTVYTNGVLEGWVPQAGNPFGSVELTVTPRKRQRPQQAHVEALMELELTPGSVEYDARNAFLLQFYLHGARISEALLLEWGNVSEHRVEYLPRKRSKKRKSVPLNPGLRWVLQRCERSGPYVLPYLKTEDARLPEAALLARLKSATESVRYGLSFLSDKLALPFRLTSHMARHAFADAALAQLEDLRVLQQMLGHASIRTTENYVADLRQEQLDQASGTVYGTMADSQGNNRETFTGNGAATGKARTRQKRPKQR